MVTIERLRVSLTKNGYLKIWVLVKNHPSDEILDNVYGVHEGVNLAASQVRNILGADATSGVVPAYWDEIREHDDRTIMAFTFLAIVFSHHRLINALLEAGNGEAEGTISRDDLTSKEYTNLVYAMAELGLCEYERGAESVDYDLSSLADQLRPARDLVQRLLRDKLARCGWRDPDQFPASDDLPLLLECRRQRFHEVLGMSFTEFTEWFTGQRRLPRR